MMSDPRIYFVLVLVHCIFVYNPTEKSNIKDAEMQHTKQLSYVCLLLQKIDRRSDALQKIDWSERKKEKVKKIMKREYHSSEESGEEEGSKIVRGLQWESEKLTTYKKSLDSFYFSTMKNSCNMKKVIRKAGVVSNRQPPQGALQWTVSVNEEIEN